MRPHGALTSAPRMGVANADENRSSGITLRVVVSWSWKAAGISEGLASRDS
jgi:hypothetical protein